MSPIRMSRIESAIRVVLDFIEAYNRHDVAGMMLLMSEDCVVETRNPAPAGTLYTGKATVTQFWHAFFDESPEAHLEIEEIFGSGARCVVRCRYDWIDLAGEKRYIRGADIFQVRNGLICEKFSYAKS